MTAWRPSGLSRACRRRKLTRRSPTGRADEHPLTRRNAGQQPPPIRRPSQNDSCSRTSKTAHAASDSDGPLASRPALIADHLFVPVRLIAALPSIHRIVAAARLRRNEPSRWSDAQGSYEVERDWLEQARERFAEAPAEDRRRVRVRARPNYARDHCEATPPADLTFTSRAAVRCGKIATGAAPLRAGPLCLERAPTRRRALAAYGTHAVALRC